MADVGGEYNSDRTGPTQKIPPRSTEEKAWDDLEKEMMMVM